MCSDAGKSKPLSAVYLLPSQRDPSWTRLLTGVAQILRVKISQNVHVHAYHERLFIPDLTAWSCTLAGLPARALHDGGAQLNLVSERFAARHGLGYPSATIPITLGNGQQTYASGEISMQLKLQAWQGCIPVHVMRLPDQYDLILGDAFIRQTCAITESDEHGLKSMSLKKGEKRVTVNRAESSARCEVSAPLMSAMQAAKAVRRTRENYWFVRVTEKDAHSVLCAHSSVGQSDDPELIPNERLQALD